MFPNMFVNGFMGEVQSHAQQDLRLCVHELDCPDEEPAGFSTAQLTHLAVYKHAPRGRASRGEVGAGNVHVQDPNSYTSGIMAAAPTQTQHPPSVYAGDPHTHHMSGGATDVPRGARPPQHNIGNHSNTINSNPYSPSNSSFTMNGHVSGSATLAAAGNTVAKTGKPCRESSFWLDCNNSNPLTMPSQQSHSSSSRNNLPGQTLGDSNNINNLLGSDIEARAKPMSSSSSGMHDAHTVRPSYGSSSQVPPLTSAPRMQSQSSIHEGLPASNSFAEGGRSEVNGLGGPDIGTQGGTSVLAANFSNEIDSANNSNVVPGRKSSPNHPPTQMMSEESNATSANSSSGMHDHGNTNSTKSRCSAFRCCQATGCWLFGWLPCGSVCSTYWPSFLFMFLFAVAALYMSIDKLAEGMKDPKEDKWGWTPWVAYVAILYGLLSIFSQTFRDILRDAKAAAEAALRSAVTVVYRTTVLSSLRSILAIVTGIPDRLNRIEAMTVRLLDLMRSPRGFAPGFSRSSISRGRRREGPVVSKALLKQQRIQQLCGLSSPSQICNNRRDLSPEASAEGDGCFVSRSSEPQQYQHHEHLDQEPLTSAAHQSQPLGAFGQRLHGLPEHQLPRVDAHKRRAAICLLDFQQQQPPPVSVRQQHHPHQPTPGDLHCQLQQQQLTMQHGPLSSPHSSVPHHRQSHTTLHQHQLPVSQQEQVLYQQQPLSLQQSQQLCLQQQQESQQGYQQVLSQQQQQPEHHAHKKHLAIALYAHRHRLSQPIMTAPLQRTAICVNDASSPPTSLFPVADGQGTSTAVPANPRLPLKLADALCWSDRKRDVLSPWVGQRWNSKYAPAIIAALEARGFGQLPLPTALELQDQIGKLAMQGRDARRAARKAAAAAAAVQLSHRGDEADLGSASGELEARFKAGLQGQKQDETPEKALLLCESSSLYEFQRANEEYLNQAVEIEYRNGTAPMGYHMQVASRLRTSLSPEGQQLHADIAKQVPKGSRNVPDPSKMRQAPLPPVRQHEAPAPVLDPHAASEALVSDSNNSNPMAASKSTPPSLSSSSSNHDGGLASASLARATGAE